MRLDHRLQDRSVILVTDMVHCHARVYLVAQRATSTYCWDTGRETKARRGKSLGLLHLVLELDHFVTHDLEILHVLHVRENLRHFVELALIHRAHLL